MVLLSLYIVSHCNPANRCWDRQTTDHGDTKRLGQTEIIIAVILLEFMSLLSHPILELASSEEKMSTALSGFCLISIITADTINPQWLHGTERPHYPHLFLFDLSVHIVHFPPSSPFPDPDLPPSFMSYIFSEQLQIALASHCLSLFYT